MVLKNGCEEVVVGCAAVELKLKFKKAVASRELESRIDSLSLLVRIDSDER